MGTLTVMKTLKSGTRFYSHNGDFDGLIIEKNGVKYIEAYGKEDFELKENEEFMLKIDITTCDH